MKKGKQRKYSWHQKGGIAGSESPRWGCRLLHHIVFSNKWKKTKHRKYIWHQKGGIAVSESKRWGCRLLPHALVLSTNEKKQSIGNTADTRKVASLLVSQWVNKMGLSFPTPCSYFQQMKKTKHRKYSRHQKSGIAAGESMSQQDGAVVSYPM